MKSPNAEALSSPAIVNPGWFGYAYGFSGDPEMIIDVGPNSVLGDSLMAAEALDAPDRFALFELLPARENLPPQMFDGSAQRAHPNILSLAEFTPIGPGEIWIKDVAPTSQPLDQLDLEAWAQGLGQLANAIALIGGAATLDGDPSAQGAGIDGQGIMLSPSYNYTSVGTVSPQPGGPTFDGLSPPPVNFPELLPNTGGNLVGPNPPVANPPSPIFTFLGNLFGFTNTPGS